MRFKSDSFDAFKGLGTPDDSADLSTGNVFCEQELPPGLVTCKRKSYISDLMLYLTLWK